MIECATPKTLSLYTFRSAKNREITIKSTAEDIARHVAMFNLWGPAHGWCSNRGVGLHLTSVTECATDAPVELNYMIGEMGGDDAKS